MYLILFVIIILIVLLGTVALTGHDKRTYKVLKPDDTIEIAGERVLVSELAITYKPKMFLRSSVKSPPLLWTYYEAVPNDKTVDLIYYYVWENEINPNPFIHKYYSIFRALYYGYPLYDIEYFQVNVSRSDSYVAGLRFETSPVNDYYTTVTEHIAVHIDKSVNGNYNEQRFTQGGKLIKRTSNISVKFDEPHVLVGVQTWAHVSCLLNDNDYDIYLNAPLKPLTSEDYRHYKFVRKSQGDHKTFEKFFTRLLSSLVKFLFVTLPASIILMISSIKK